jgi:hypothetical protein
MNNILFLENKIYLQKLGIFTKIKKFDANRIYKISDEDILKFDGIISQFYTNPLSNFLIIKSKLNHISTILISDGIIEWENCFSNPMNTKYNLKLFHPVLHDIFLCVGKDETEYFNFLGYKTMQYLPDRMNPSIPRIGKSNNDTFLITTANTAYYNKNEKKNLITLIKQITSILDELEYQYVFRVFDDSLINELNIDYKKNIKSGSYEECLKKVDYVITTPSSISYTTMYHGKALAHLIYRDSPIFIQSGWNISGSICIEDTLKSMISYDKDRINFQEYQVSKYMIDNEKVEKEVLEELKKYKSENIEKFINQNLYNMLNSSFNFNIEYFVRKIYSRFKSFKIMKILRGKLK